MLTFTSHYQTVCGSKVIAMSSKRSSSMLPYYQVNVRFTILQGSQEQRCSVPTTWRSDRRIVILLPVESLMFYDILLVGRSSSTLWYDVLASTIAMRIKGPLLSVIYILPCVQSLPLPSTQESIPTTWRSISAPSINTNFNTNLNINNNHNLILPHGDFRHPTGS